MPSFSSLLGCLGRVLTLPLWYSLQWFVPFSTLTPCASSHRLNSLIFTTTFLIGAGCYWLIGAPSAWLMAFTLGWGPTGVWWGLALGLACAAVSLTWAFEAKMKRMIRREPETYSTLQAAQPD